MHKKDVNESKNCAERIVHCGKSAELSYKSACAHACAGRSVCHAEQSRGNRAQDRRGERRSKPYLGMIEDIAELEHRCAYALRNKASETVIAEGCDGKSHHLAAAAHACGACRDPVKTDHYAERSRAYRSRKRKTDNN